MKRSKRERFLLGLLMLVSIWALALKCFILPGQGRLAEAREHLRTVKEEQSKAELYLKHYPDLRERLEELKEEEGGEFFYRDIDDVFMDRNIQELAGRRRGDCAPGHRDACTGGLKGGTQGYGGRGPCIRSRR